MTKRTSVARKSFTARLSFGGLSVNFRQLFASLAYACQLPSRALGLLPAPTTGSGFVHGPRTARKKAGTLLAVGEKMRRVGEWVERAVDLAVATSVGTSRHSGKPWAALEPLEPRQLMTTLYWDTSAAAGLQGGSGMWASGTNWNTDPNGGTATLVGWTNGADAVFANGSGTVTISPNVTANSVTFSSAGYLVTSGVLSLSGSAAITANQNAEIASTVVGTSGLAESGTCTLILSHSNGYSGTTTVAAGSTLQVGNASTTGSLGTGNVTNNGTLAFKHSDAITVSNVISGTGTLSQQGSGTLILTGANTYSGGTTINPGTVQVGSGSSSGSLGTGTITNNGALVVYRTGTVTISDVITGFGSLNNKGTGTLTLATSNTYTGITRVQAGVLRLGHSSAMYSSLVQLNATDSGSVSFGALTVATFGGLQGSRALTLSNTASQAVTLTVSTNTNNSYTYSGVLSGNGKLFVDGTGTLTLTGTNTYSGATTINGSSTLQVGSGGTTGSMGSGAIVNNGALRINTNGVVTLSNQISGAGPLTKVGTGTLTLSGNNSNFSGITRIGAGMLTLGHVNALYHSKLDMDQADSGTLSFADQSTYQVGGLEGERGIVLPYNTGLNDRLYSGSTIFSGTLSGAGDFGVSTSMATLTLLGANDYSGLTNVSSPASLQVGMGGTVGSLGTGPIQGNGTVIFNRSGTVTAPAQSNVNLVQMGGGMLVLNGTGIYLKSIIIMNGGTLQIGDACRSSSGSITNNGSLILNCSGTSTLGKVVYGSGSVQVEGSGTVTLTGANDYSGGTTVSTGSTLQVGNGTDGTLGTGDLTVNGSLIINEPSSMTIWNLTCGSGSLLNFVMDDAGQSGSLKVNGTLSLTGASLVLTGSRTLSTSNSCTLIDNDGGGTITTAFSGYPDGSLVTDTMALRYDISYHGGDGQDVVVTDDQYPWVRTIQLASANSYMNAQRVMFIVDFTRPVTGVTASDFAPVTNIAGTQVLPVTGTDAEYTITVDTGSSNGTLGLTLIDHDSIHSVNGSLTLGGTVNANYTASSYYTLDRTAPTNLNATASSLTCMQLTWVDNASDEAGFQVERSSNGGQNFTPLSLLGESASGVSATVTYYDNTIEPNTDYIYHVRATRSSGTNSIWSALSASARAQERTTTWTAGSGGNWNVSGNWDNGVPDIFADAVIANTNGGTVTFNNSPNSTTLNSLTVNDPLVITAGHLNVVTTACLASDVQLQGGTLTGGTITQGDSNFWLKVTGGTLDAVTLNGNAVVEPGGTLTVTDGLILNSTLTLDGSGSVSATTLKFLNSQTLTGTGVLLLTGTYGCVLATKTLSGATLTIGSGVTLSGQGNVVADTNCRLLNYGTIVSDSDRDVNLGPVNNDGDISVTDGTATLTGLSNSGTVGVTGATLNVIGTWTNAGTITAANGVLNLGGTVSTGSMGDDKP